MKKPKIARIYALEKKLKTLKKINCSPNLKRKLRKAARDWINWEKQHVKDLHGGKWGENVGDDIGRNYHHGSISMLETFFNLNNFKSKPNKKK